jgi:phage-related minor tail protein
MTKPPPNPPPPAPGSPDRLQRVEESLGFAEHEQEQLGQQVVRLQQQVLALTQRIQQLEGVLERVVKRAVDGSAE